MLKLKFGTQNALLVYFWEKIVTFGIGLVFSESPGPGLGRLYKVYLVFMFRNTPLRSYNLEYH